MISVTPELKKQLGAMPARQRAELAEFLLRSLGARQLRAPSAKDKKLLAKLDRRWAEIKNGKETGQDAFEALNELRKKHRESRRHAS